MGNAIKFIKNKLCKTCNKELYYGKNTNILDKEN